MKKRTLLIAAASTAGLVSLYGATAFAVSQTAAPVSPPATVANTAASQAEATTPETASVTETPETGTSATADTAGGHQDAAGTNADHQFSGQE